MNRILQDLVNLLDLEPLEVNLFRGQSRDLGGKSVFGGQVLGQAMVAASRTIEEMAAHSLHAYFLRPGDMAAPIVYDVERTRDGRSFSARRVKAIQHGRPIFTMMVSFQHDEAGLEHQAPMPAVAQPEELRLRSEYRQEILDSCPEKLRKPFTRELAIEFKEVEPMNPFAPAPGPAEQYIWFRAADGLPDDDEIHRCVLAYASDFNLLSTAMRPHGITYLLPNVIAASIDHAIWFHRPFRVDDWLLYAMDSPSAQSARGLSRGLIYDRDGNLVASVSQESLMRIVDPGNR